MAKNQGNTRGQRANNATTGQGVAAEGGATRRAAPKAKEPKRYRALQRGYVDGRIVEPGEVFATAETEGSWMEPLDKSAATKSRAQEAADDTMASKKDDPDLTTFSHEALEAEALRLGLTDASGLSDEDLIAAIRAAYVNPAQ